MAQVQSAEQIRCTAGKELQPDLAGLDELGSVLPKKRVCRRQPSKPSRAYHETSIFREAIRRFERVSKIPRGNSTTTSRLAWSIHFQVESPGRKSEKCPRNSMNSRQGSMSHDSRARILRNPPPMHSALRWTNPARRIDLPGCRALLRHHD